VLDISAASGTVTVGPAESLDVLEIEAQRPVWTGCLPPVAPIDCLVQLRAHGAACPATVTPEGTGLRIRLAEPARGIASGQAAVLYDGDTVLGSATITGTGRASASRVSRAGTGRTGTSPAGTSPAGTSPAGTSPVDTSPADTGRADTGRTGASRTAPADLPAGSRA
jgi:hypothetical protein